MSDTHAGAKKLLGVLVIAGLCIACEPRDEQKTAYEQQQSERAKDAQRCRDGGGIPITSAWDGRIIDCKAVPKP